MIEAGEFPQPGDTQEWEMRPQPRQGLPWTDGPVMMAMRWLFNGNVQQHLRGLPQVVLVHHRFFLARLGWRIQARVPESGQC
jgi:hypothetical protein